MKSLHHYLSYIFSVTIQTYESKLNGPLQVRMEGGRKVLQARKANYSFASLHIVFQKAFKHLPLKEKPPKNMLLLGMGGGSVVSILRDEYGLDTSVTAVEYDPVVVQIATDHFEINKYKNLEIEVADAFQYMDLCSDNFDLIVVDIFTDLLMPPETMSNGFLRNLIKATSKEGYLILNYIIKTEEQKGLFNTASILLSKEGELQTFKSGTNRVLIWRKH